MHTLNSRIWYDPVRLIDRVFDRRINSRRSRRHGGHGGAAPSFLRAPVMPIPGSSSIQLQPERTGPSNAPVIAEHGCSFGM